MSKETDKLLLFDYFIAFDEFIREQRKILKNMAKLSIRFNLQKTLDNYMKN